MASIFGHAITAYTISRIADQKQSRRLTILAIISAVLPDIDVMAFNFGIPYEHMLGHRGLTHSIAFAVIWSSFCLLFIEKNSRRIGFLVLFFSTISHGVLDAMTSGGRGVGFLIPFSDERYFLPFRQIVVSPLGVESFFSQWGMQVILSELKYIFLPCLIILGLNYVTKKLFK